MNLLRIAIFALATAGLIYVSRAALHVDGCCDGQALARLRHDQKFDALRDDDHPAGTRFRDCLKQCGDRQREVTVGEGDLASVRD